MLKTSWMQYRQRVEPLSGNPRYPQGLAKPRDSPAMLNTRWMQYRQCVEPSSGNKGTGFRVQGFYGLGLGLGRAGHVEDEVDAVQAARGALLGQLAAARLQQGQHAAPQRAKLLRRQRVARVPHQLLRHKRSRLYMGSYMLRTLQQGQHAAPQRAKLLRRQRLARVPHQLLHAVRVRQARAAPDPFQTPAWHVQLTPCVSYVQHVQYGDTPTKVRSWERHAAVVFLQRPNGSCRKVEQATTQKHEQSCMTCRDMQGVMMAHDACSGCRCRTSMIPLIQA